MRYAALATIAATLLCSMPAKAVEYDYKSITGAWTIVGNHVGHSSVTCTMYRNVEKTGGGGAVFLYELQMSSEPTNIFLSIYLTTQFPADSKPQATVTFSNGKTVNLKGDVDAANMEEARAVMIDVPIDKTGKAFTEGLTSAASGMTIVLTLAAADGKPAQKETTTVSLAGADDALTLQRECMKDTARKMLSK